MKNAGVMFQLKEVDSGRKIPIIDHVFDLDREFYVAKLADTLIAGKAYSIQVSIHYSSVSQPFLRRSAISISGGNPRCLNSSKDQSL